MYLYKGQIERQGAYLGNFLFWVFKSILCHYRDKRKQTKIKRTKEKV